MYAKKFFGILLFLLAGLTVVYGQTDNKRSGELFSGGEEDGYAASCLPPEILETGPLEYTCVSDSIVLWVKAKGTGLTYVWERFNINKGDYMELDTADTRYSGLATSRLVIRNVNADDNGLYLCRVVNTCDEATQVFNLDMDTRPEIVTGLNQNLSYRCVGESQVLCINATSMKNDLNYAWYLKDTTSGNITVLNRNDQRNKMCWEINTDSREGQGLYIVEISSPHGCGTVVDSAYQRIYSPVVVSYINADANNRIKACEGNSVDMEIGVTGGGEYTFVLKKVEVKSYSPLVYEPISVIDSAVSKVTLPEVTLDMAGEYVWEVTNNCGSDFKLFSLVVHKRPEFTELSSDTLSCEEKPLKLTAIADGVDLRYDWYRNGEFTGLTGLTVTISSLTEETAGIYRCYVYSDVCTRQIPSDPVTVTLDPLPRALFTAYQHLIEEHYPCVNNDTACMSVVLDDRVRVDSIRWFLVNEYHPLYDDGNKISGSDTKDLYINHPTLEDKAGGFYFVKAYNHCGGRKLGEVDMQLSEPARLVKGLSGYEKSGFLLCANTGELKVSAMGTKPIRYTWLCNDKLIAESNDSVTKIDGSLVLPDAEYTIYVNNVCGGDSEKARLNIVKIEQFPVLGGGEYCGEQEPNGVIKLPASDTAVNYILYREFALGDVLVKEMKGTGDTLTFIEDAPAGMYYVIGQVKASGEVNTQTCEQEMLNRLEVKMMPTPVEGKLLQLKQYCLDENNDGAVLGLSVPLEQGVRYELQKKTEDEWGTCYSCPDNMFIVGRPGYPAAGIMKTWENMDIGEYRVIATNFDSKYSCVRTYSMDTAVLVRFQPEMVSLNTRNGEKVICSGSGDTKELEIDGKVQEGCHYQLLRNGEEWGGITAKTRWANIGVGIYTVRITNEWGCSVTSRPFQIYEAPSPVEVSFKGSGWSCDPETELFKTMTIGATQQGITYSVYKAPEGSLFATFDGTGRDTTFHITTDQGNYYIEAKDALSGLCKRRMIDEYQVGVSDFEITASPSQIVLDKGEGIRAHLSVSVMDCANCELPQWYPAIEDGKIQNPTTQWHKQYYYPFCPCARQHDAGYGYWYGSGDYWHKYYNPAHNGCTPTTCPTMYHNWINTDAAKGCIFQYTARSSENRPWYDYYFCPDQVVDEYQIADAKDDPTFPYSVWTKPINDEITYYVSVADAHGCVKRDSVVVKVTGKKLIGHITTVSHEIRYEPPYCPCCNSGYDENLGWERRWHLCDANCFNGKRNCWKQYHQESVKGCFYQGLHTITRRSNPNYPWYKEYICKTGEQAPDNIAVDKFTELFFASEVEGGDYKYTYRWSFKTEDNELQSMNRAASDTVRFTAMKSGYLYLEVWSMGMYVKDSVWINVSLPPFNAQIRDYTCEAAAADTVRLCRGEGVIFCGWAQGGTGNYTYFWINEQEEVLSTSSSTNGAHSGALFYEPTESGYVWMIASTEGEDGLEEIRDSVFVYMVPAPKRIAIDDPGVRCVEIGKQEIIRLPETEKGLSYILQHRTYNGSYEQVQRLDNADGSSWTFGIENPVRDAGMYRVMVEKWTEDKACYLTLDSLDFITPAAEVQIVDTTYCRADGGLIVSLRSMEDNVRYTICTSDGRVSEAIEKPDYSFKSKCEVGDYWLQREHIGIMGSCSTKQPFSVRRGVDPDLSLELGVSGKACENGNTQVVVKATEPGVTYELCDEEAQVLARFVGDGSDLQFNKFLQRAGNYRIKATGPDGCYGWLTHTVRVFELPAEISVDKINYCYTANQDPQKTLVPVELSGLQSNVVYYLYKNSGIAPVDSIEGPNIQRYKNYWNNGQYQIKAVSKTTGCVAPRVSFTIQANPKPYRFTIDETCGAAKNVVLQHSEVPVTYHLHRDDDIIASLPGQAAGDPLVFPIQNKTGVYWISAQNDTSFCADTMRGRVVIYELDTCRLKVKGYICENDSRAGAQLSVLYSCPKPGWTFYLEEYIYKTNGTVTHNYADTLAEGSAGWNRTVKPSKSINRVRYELWARNQCDTLLVDSVAVFRNDIDTSYLAPIPAACRGEEVPITVIGGNPNRMYILETDFDGKVEEDIRMKGQEGVFTMGQYRDQTVFRLITTSLDGGCRSIRGELNREISPTPQVLDIIGRDTCINVDGSIQLCLPNGRHPQVVYYLANRDGVCDSITPDIPGNCFTPQTEHGYYYVWGLMRNAKTTSSVKDCQTLMNGRYTLGAPPEVFQLEADVLESGVTEIGLCEGQDCGLRLSNSEPDVVYDLYRDGEKIAEVVGRDHQALLFGRFSEAGEYTVKARRGCIVDMANTVTVKVGKYPTLSWKSDYLYCPGTQGTELEVFCFDYGCTLELGKLDPEYVKLEEQTSVKFEDTVRFTTPCPAGFVYRLKATSRDGCSVEKEFVTYMDSLPDDSFQLTSSHTHLCEENCAELTLSGSEAKTEYVLWNKRTGMDEFSWTAADEGRAISFPEICDEGTFYVVATHHYYPRCSARMQGEVTLEGIDTIQSIPVKGGVLYHCIDDADGVSITLPRSQPGTVYELYADGNLMSKIEPKSSPNGSPLTWTGVTGTLFDGTVESGKLYSVVGTRNGCSKVMPGLVKVIAERPLNGNDIIGVDTSKTKACVGEEIHFMVGMDYTVKSGNLQYQWYKNGGPYDGKTDMTLRFDSVQMSDFGYYMCKVTNSCSKTISTPEIDLKVLSVPYVKNHLKDTSYCENTYVYISNEMGSVEEDDFRWYRPDGKGNEVRKSFLRFNPITKADEGMYVCEGSSGSTGCPGMVARDTFWVWVDANADSLKFNRIKDTVCTGSYFAVDATPLKDFDSKVWSWNHNGEATGIKGWNFEIDEVTSRDAGTYSVAWSDGCGDHELQMADLVVDDSLKIVQITPDATKCAGVPLKLYVYTNGAPGRTEYWWTQGDKHLFDGQIHTVVLEQSAINPTYHAFAKNKCGLISAPVNIRLNGEIKITWPPKEIQLCSAAAPDTTLCVKVERTPVYGSTWIYQKKLVAKRDTVGRDLCLKIPVKPSSTGFYHCVVNTGCGMFTDSTTWVRIDSVPALEAFESVAPLCVKGTHEIVANATGGHLYFEWTFTRKDGTVRWTKRDEKLDFNCNSTFKIGPMEQEDDEGVITCITRNGCGESTQTMTVRVDRAREVVVEPKDAVFCEGGEANIEVTLKYGSAPWFYRCIDKDSVVIAERKATTETDVLAMDKPGEYSIMFMSDGGKCNYANGETDFKVSQLPASQAEISVVGRDTVCSGEKVQVKVDISFPSYKNGDKLPEGPWEVSVIRKDGSPATEMNITFPKVIYRENETDKVISFVVDSFPVLKNETYYIGSFKDLGGGACPGNIVGEAEFTVMRRDTLRFSFDNGVKDTLGYCKTINLRDMAKPNMEGIFLIDGNKFGDIFSSRLPLDTGRHIVTYKTGGQCESSNAFFYLWLADKPALEVIPRDTALCPGASCNVILKPSGAAPFDIRYEIRNTDRTGTVKANVLDKSQVDEVVIPVDYFFKNDSVRKITPMILRDRFGCEAGTLDTMAAYLWLRSEPEFSVWGIYEGEESDVRDPYIIPEGDTVQFRVELLKGGTPWNLDVSTPKGMLYLGPIAHKDTVISVTDEGEYFFWGRDAWRCVKAGAMVDKHVFFKEDGFVRIKTLLQGPYNSKTGKMNAELQRLGVLPKRGLTGNWPVTGADSVVDWITVEVRSDLNVPALSCDTFLLRNDGQLIDRTGNDTLQLKSVSNLRNEDSYYVILKHRNHVSVLSKNKVKVVDDVHKKSVVTIDFTKEENVYAISGSLVKHMYKLDPSGIWGMAAGYDLTPDQLVSISNPNETKFATEKEVQASYVGYYLRDVNMNGIVEWPENGTDMDDPNSVYKNADAWKLYKNRDIYSSDPLVTPK